MEMFSSDVHKMLIQGCRNITRGTDKEKTLPIWAQFYVSFSQGLRSKCHTRTSLAMHVVSPKPTRSFSERAISLSTAVIRFARVPFMGQHF